MKQLDYVIFFLEANGLCSLFYRLFLVFGVISAFTVAIVRAYKYGVNLKKAVLLTLWVIILAVFAAFFFDWVEKGFTRWGGKELVRIFIWIPVFAYPATKLLKMNFRQSLEFLAPCICAFQGISKLGCFIVGCCRGYPWRYGIYNHATHYRTFPIQLVEAAVSIVIVIIIFRISKKNRYEVTGKLFPLMLMMYGFSRFVIEFARNNDKILLGLSSFAIHALIIGLTGMSWYLIIREKNKGNTTMEKKIKASGMRGKNK